MEVRVHGRGGQGAVLASLILARAAFRGGYAVQSFPEFGVERRGAPVSAFLRLSDKPILNRSKIYNPDSLLVLDPTLLELNSVLDGLKPESTLVINYAGEAPWPVYLGAWSAFRVDASSIASSLGLGSAAIPVVNTVMVGAFAKATNLMTLDDLTDAIAETFPDQAEKNISAARLGFEKCQTV